MHHYRIHLLLQCTIIEYLTCNYVSSAALPVKVSIVKCFVPVAYMIEPGIVEAQKHTLEHKMPIKHVMHRWTVDSCLD